MSHIEEGTLQSCLQAFPLFNQIFSQNSCYSYPLLQSCQQAFPLLNATHSHTRYAVKLLSCNPACRLFLFSTMNYPISH